MPDLWSSSTMEKNEVSFVSVILITCRVLNCLRVFVKFFYRVKILGYIHPVVEGKHTGFLYNFEKFSLLKCIVVHIIFKDCVDNSFDGFSSFWCNNCLQGLFAWLLSEVGFFILCISDFKMWHCICVCEWYDVLLIFFVNWCADFGTKHIYSQLSSLEYGLSSLCPD